MQKQLGFTLIELLVVMSIVTALTLIALPQYRAYKQRAFDFRALSDLRTVALAEEGYFMDSERYLSCSNASCASLPGVSRLSDGVDLSIAAADESFSGTAKHHQGTGKQFVWDTTKGGLVP